MSSEVAIVTNAISLRLRLIGFDRIEDVGQVLP